MANVRRVVIVAVVALFFGACGTAGTRPVAPTTSFRPAAIGILVSEDSIGCGAQHVRLASGQSVDLTFSLSGSPSETCPPAPIAYSAGGTADYLFPQIRDLLMWGQDTTGKWWWIEAEDQAGNPEAANDGFAYALRGGSFEEGQTFHLPSGLVLDKAPTYRAPNGYASPLVVPREGGLGLDVQGRVTRALMPVSPR